MVGVLPSKQMRKPCGFESRLSLQFTGVAQLVERLFCKEKVSRVRILSCAPDFRYNQSYDKQINAHVV